MEFLQVEIQVCFERPAYLYKNQHVMGFQRLKRRAQNSKRPIQKSKRRQLSQKLGLLTNHRFQISKSVSFLSLVSTRHTQTQLYENHGKFVEASISDSKDAPVSLSLVSTGHTQTQLCENHRKFVESPIPTIYLSQPRQL
ncbi:hypothetical protein ACFX11_013293 [Malus domestica]